MLFHSVCMLSGYWGCIGRSCKSTNTKTLKIFKLNFLSQNYLDMSIWKKDRIYKSRRRNGHTNNNEKSQPNNEFTWKTPLTRCPLFQNRKNQSQKTSRNYIFQDVIFNDGFFFSKELSAVKIKKREHFFYKGYIKRKERHYCATKFTVIKKIKKKLILNNNMQDTNRYFFRLLLFINIWIIKWHSCKHHCASCRQSS